MSRRLLRILRWFSLPLFLLTLAMAIRTATFHGFDVFDFGFNHGWVCTALVEIRSISVDLETGEPPFEPALDPAATGWFFDHSAGNSFFRVRGGLVPFPISQTTHQYRVFDYGNLRWETFYSGGRAVKRNFHLSLSYAPLIMLLLTSLIQLHWWYQIIKRRRIRSSLPERPCPTCSYDLRAHTPGNKCPECGTLIPTRL